MLSKITLVLGGASSGKSALAERLVTSAKGRAVYIATAQAFDGEMSDRIERHKTGRDDCWHTVEQPLDVAKVLDRMSADDVVLIDCLTMWLSNHMEADSDLTAEQARLVAALKFCAAPIVIVSNEVGLGGIAENALARRFGELQGRLNITVAAEAGLVITVIAGLPMVLKGTLPEDFV